MLVCFSFDVFNNVFTQITSDYGVMVINNRIHSTDITKVFWYKAKEKHQILLLVQEI